MNDRPAAALLLALGTFLGGCAGPARLGPAHLGQATTPAAASVEGAPTRPDADGAAMHGVKAAAGDDHLDPTEAAPAANRLEAFPSAVAARVADGPCRAETAKGFTGFYASDPWEKGEVVLTFDDGPHPKGTPRVLDLLAEHGMPATFFVVGRAISRETVPLVQRIVADGHTLGSHSYSHDVHMTRVHAPAATHDDIVGQHRVTTLLVDLALMAASGDDFDAMYTEVFRRDPATWLAASTIRREHEAFAARHAALLATRGFDDGRRPYDVLYSRPPGGGPYVEHDGAAGIAIHDDALEALALVNVMWHGASGDTDPVRRGDFAFLTGNIARTAASGGVLLVHDYIRQDALAHALADLASRRDVRVISIDEAVERKFGCSRGALAASLRGPSAPAVARAP